LLIGIRPGQNDDERHHLLVEAQYTIVNSERGATGVGANRTEANFKTLSKRDQERV